MAYANANKAAIVATYARTQTDTGSPEVQCALLTRRMDELQSHLAKNPSDANCARSIKKIAQRRTSLLLYLARKDEAKYLKLIASLRIKDARPKA